MVFKMKYVISGCTGCIGVSLINKLNTKDNEITVILNPGSARNSVIENMPKLSIIYAELGQYIDIGIVENKDIFIHMAWSGGLERDNFEINQFSSFATVEALIIAQRIGCKKFISIGSQAEYGLTTEIIDEKTRCIPINEFGIAKLNTYFRLREKVRELDIELIWLRVLSAYGPFDRSSSMIMNTIHSLLKGRDIKLSKCTQKWDFLHSDDIADAIIGLSTTVNTKDLYVIGSDADLELKSYVKEMLQGFNVNEQEIFGKAMIDERNLVEIRSDSTQLRKDIGWYPKTSFADGIKTLVLTESLKQ